MNELLPENIARLQEAISVLEEKRAILGDAVVNSSLAALREQLATAEAVLRQREEISAPRLVTCLAVQLSIRDRDVAPNYNQGYNAVEYTFNLLGEVVRQYNGTVHEVSESQMLAFFSGGHDDPSRSAYAALSIRQKLSEYSTELEQKGVGNLSFRLGVNIGMLALGSLTSTINGDATTVNVALALAQAAPNNTILISQQIHTYLTDNFIVEPSAPVEVVQKRIPTFQLSGARQTVQVQRRETLPDMPFMGRDAAIRTILRQIEQFSAGNVIIVSGEAGLGKSRLINEIRQAAPMLQWLTMYSEQLPIKPVYGAWNNLLLQLAGLQATSTKKEIEKALQEWLTDHDIAAHCYWLLANQLGLSPLEDTPPENKARQLVEVWQTLLTAVVRQHPTVLVFEDAQAMDSSSLALMERLIELLQNLPIVWMIVTQPIFNQPISKTVMRLGQRGRTRFTYLGLEPIDEQNTLDLLNLLVGVKSLPDPLEAGILERAQGNPLFLQHIVRALIENRGLVCDPRGKWVATAAALADPMPNTLRDVIQMRIHLLPEEEQQFLQRSAVAGNTVFPFLLKTPHSNSAAGDPASLLRDAGLLNPGPQYFHGIIRDSIYQAIPKLERAAMHRQAAGALASYCELAGPWLAVMAYHMDKGLQTQGALDTYARAKAWAYANNALTEVAEIIGAMLELLNEHDSPEQVAELLVEQQDMLYKLDPSDPRCKQILERAYGLWVELGKISETADTLLRMAVHHAGTLNEDQYYRDAQTLLERDNPRHPMLPGVYLRRALYAAAQGWADNTRAAEELFDRARTLALQLQDVDALAHVHFEMGLYLRDHHQLTDALAAFQHALSYFSQLEDVPPDERVLTCNYLADLYYHLGQPAKGEYFALEAVAGARRTTDLIQVLPFVTLSECYAAQARWPEAIQAIEDAPRELAPPEMPLDFWRGRWIFEEGNTLEGLELMREALPTDNVECVMVFIDYLVDADFGKEASILLQRLLQQTEPDEDVNTSVLTQAYTDRLRGRLAGTNKDYARAISLLDRAMNQFSREGYVLLSISTRRVYAATLLERCDNGDEQAARLLLEEALASCKKLSIHAENRRLQNAMRAHWPGTSTF